MDSGDILGEVDPLSNRNENFLWSSLENNGMPLLPDAVEYDVIHKAGQCSDSSANNILTPSYSSSSSDGGRQQAMSSQGSATRPQLQHPVTRSADTHNPHLQGGQSSNIEAKPETQQRRYSPDELEKMNSVRASSACIRCQVMEEAVCHYFCKSQTNADQDGLVQ